MPPRTINISQHLLTKHISSRKGQKKCLNLCRINLSYAFEDTKFISTCVDQIHSMPERTLNVSQHVLRGRKMYHNQCWPNLSHACEDRKYISSCVDQTRPMFARELNVSQHVLPKPILSQRGHKMYLNICWPNPTHARGNRKCISTCVDLTYLMSARTQNLSQLELTKPLPCQWEHKMYLNMCWQNAPHSSEDTKCIIICVGQSRSMPGRTYNVS